jgi:oxygen-independent coproporphyrinogen-3 oxidase
VNLDLIFAVPGQTLESWLGNLRAAIAIGPDHLSCYGLTYERGTPLYDRLQAGEVKRLDPDAEAAMYEATIDTLASPGYQQYEISNFAQPGCECRHNLAYWHNLPHVGIGPSAAGCVSGARYKNIADAAEYGRAIRSGRSPRTQEERLSPEHHARETAMLELRLNAGIDRQRFQRRFGVDPLRLFGEAIAKHAGLELIEVTPEAVRLTRRGRLVADSVVADFL